jgi:tartrate-resistant acid phosphatase type 5
MAAAALAFLNVAALCWDTAAAALPRLEHPPKSDDGSLSLLVVRDWGRKGTHN